MISRVIVDTGPLVAFMNGRDRYHQWSMMQWARIEPPLLTCEAVLSETCFLLKGNRGGQDAVLELLRRGILNLPFRLSEHVDRIKQLLNKYADIPISLADACLVRMCEIHSDSPLLTVDGDFRVYRKSKRQMIPMMCPPDL